MPEISWDVSSRERLLIRRIGDRMLSIALDRGVVGFDQIDTLMDVTACHANGCRLRLGALLAADDFNFLHDVGGIARHLDRKTGRLGGQFVPRFRDRRFKHAEPAHA